MWPRGPTENGHAPYARGSLRRLSAERTGADNAVMPRARLVLVIIIGLLTAAAAGTLVSLWAAWFDEPDGVIQLFLWWTCTAGCASVAIIGPGWRKALGLIGLGGALVFTGIALVPFRGDWVLWVFIGVAGLGHVVVLLRPTLTGPASGLRWATVSIVAVFVGVLCLGFPESRSLIDPWLTSREVLLGLFGLVAVGSGVTFILAALANETQQPAQTLPAGARLNVDCPRCGTRQSLTIGRARCTSCRLGLLIEVDEPRCQCGYLLYGLTSNRCPECGRPIGQAQIGMPTAAGRTPP